VPDDSDDLLLEFQVRARQGQVVPLAGDVAQRDDDFLHLAMHVAE
jgi:hypothetical protein